MYDEVVISRAATISTMSGIPNFGPATLPCPPRGWDGTFQALNDPR